MLVEAADFVFKPPSQVSLARRVLVKPSASYALPHPMTTSRETLASVVEGIQRMSDADIILLEGNLYGESTRSIFKALGYDFPRVTVLDVCDCVLVEVENPLPKPFALTTFWLPNIILSCDYLITVAPFRVLSGRGCFSLKNLLGLLPATKYRGGSSDLWALSQRLGVDNIVADLYFTIPFDLGIVDARKKFIGTEHLTEGETLDCGKVFIGEPSDVDREACESMELECGYLKLIESAQRELWIL